MDAPQKYAGQHVDIFFDGKKCIHSRNCVLKLPNVFRANAKGPWVFPDSAEVEDIVALAHSCPSGAITYERHDRAKPEQPPEVNTVRVLENGPLALHADAVIRGSKTYRATLCRCGASQNKPFCDGSHSTINFRATGEPATGTVDPLPQRNGTLEVNPFKNGPLGVTGNLEILAGTGRAVGRTQKTALCRCGASKNKPYCDGSHNTIGFQAD